MENFEIPIVLFIFKRKKAIKIIQRIKEINPKRVYLLGDQGRNAEEKLQVEECRKAIEKEIDWECEVIKNYAKENKGVYENIALGAKWVFEREKKAIFLEDDNLPEISFFRFCEEMLKKYENDTRVLWICGTNYLGKYHSSNNESYVFTRHMLPCGWASWGEKFNKFYYGDLELCSDKNIIERISQNYCNKKVYSQYKDSWMSEYFKIQRGKKPISWDFQMDFSIKVNSLYGICPCNNQIRNIGVDNDSTHGGNSYSNVMTKRFCSMKSYPIQFPLNHPKVLLIDEKFEKKIGDIILYPFSIRIKEAILKRLSKMLRRIFNISEDIRVIDWLKKGR